MLALLTGTVLYFFTGLFPVCFLSTSVPPMELRPNQSVNYVKVYRVNITMNEYLHMIDYLLLALFWHEIKTKYISMIR